MMFRVNLGHVFVTPGIHISVFQEEFHHSPQYDWLNFATDPNRGLGVVRSKEANSSGLFGSTCQRACLSAWSINSRTIVGVFLANSNINGF